MSRIYNNFVNDLTFRTLLNADYRTTHNDMLSQTLDRIDKKNQDILTPNQLWVVEHNDVYTLGQAGKEEHILKRGSTPIIHTDRGGQVTWHGKGQLVLYWLFDLKSLGWSVRDLVSHAEQSIEDVVNEALTLSVDDSAAYTARARHDAPGVYIYSQVDDNEEVMLGKIASLGFKIKHGFSYHGIALNLNCDLDVFNSINPCGYAGMHMLRLADFVPLESINPASIAHIPNLDRQPGTISNLQVTENLIENISQRQAGYIPLRSPSH